MNSTFSPLKKMILAALLTGAGIYSASAQGTAPDVPKVNIPTSPEAAMFKRFGDIPIGYYTGTANISVPLYALSEGGVTVPISLNYHSSGIKVEDQATWVGLGWDLSPEGQIIQEVRGKNDDVDAYNVCTDPYYAGFVQRFQLIQDYMFLYQYGRVNAPNNCSFAQGPGFPITDPAYQDPYCIIDQLLRGVGQPDIYHYSFGNYSGSFYIHPQTHAVIKMDKKDGVVFTKSVSTGSMQAITPDGTTYNFAVIEMANAGSLQEYTGQTYKLSNITFVNSKTIDFTYGNEHYTETTKSESADALGNESLGINVRMGSASHDKKTLIRITTADTYVDFNLSTRDDINMPSTSDNSKKLSSIDITSRASGKKVKHFEFTYTYFGTYDISDKRLKLDQVQEMGYNDAGTAITTVPPYKFSYDMSVALPAKNSNSVDFWGYYNGSFNNTKLPELNFFDYLNKPEYATINMVKKYQFTGANRYANNTVSGAYMLNKITYPTGGYTQFGFETNTFTNQFIPDQSMTVQKNNETVDNSINTTASLQFKLNRTTTIHFDNKIMNGKGNYNGVTPLNYGQMQGCYITFSKFDFVGGVPTFTLIKRWDLTTVLNVDFTNNGGKAWSDDIEVLFDPNPSPYFNYQVKVEFPDNLNNVLFASIAGVTAHINYYDETGVNTSMSYGGGMRIKSIKNYTQTGSLASDKLIRYYDGKLLNKFKPITMYRANQETQSEVYSGNGHEYIGFYKRLTVLDRDFGMAGGNPIGYGRVEEIELTNGTEVSGKKVYNYYNQENKTNQDCPTLIDAMNGNIEKEEIYDASNTLVSDKNYSYSFLQPSSPNFLCINVVRLATGALVPCNRDYMTTPYTTAYYNDYGGGFIATLYGYNAYTLQCRVFQLSGVTSRQYSNGNTLTNAEAYTYNNYGMLASKTVLNSKNESLRTNYYYSSEYPTVLAIDMDMFYANMIGIPTKTETYNEGIKTTGQKTVYAHFAGTPGILPKYVYQQVRSNTEELFMTIDSYDDKGNITQYTGRNGIPVSIVWNADKTLPVAKIENATYASLLALPGALTADFRTALPNARVTTYTYKSLIGVVTITDANNKSQYYEYDAFNRLSIVRDQDNNILKKICYNYMGQTVDCSTPVATPPPGTCDPATTGPVNSVNLSSITGYTAKFTNVSTPALIYSFPITAGTQVLGCMPKAIYTLLISTPSGSVSHTFHCNGNTVTGPSATFSVNSAVITNTNISIDP